MNAIPDTSSENVLHEVAPLTPDQQHAAAVTVCARAAEMDDARHLLDTLGLLEVDRE